MLGRRSPACSNGGSSVEEFVVRSKNRAYLPAVDHLRFAAAALVVLYHGSQLLRSPTPAPPSFDPAKDWSYSLNPLKTFVFEGHTGVALFMVLSGFILTMGSLGRDIEYGSFLRNRFLRVGPLYVVLLFIAVTAGGAAFSLLGLLQTLAGFGTLPGGFTMGPFAMILWTVGVELQFYLVFPLFLRLLNSSGPRSLVLFVCSMMAFRTLAALTAPGLDLNQFTYFSLVGRIDQFLIGMLAAWAFPRVREAAGRVWLTGAAVVLAVAMLWCFNQVHGYAEPHLWRTLYVDVEAVVWAGVIVTYVSTARFVQGRMSTAAAWLGERSYGMYLLHMPLIFLLSMRGWGVSLGRGVVVDATATALLVVLPAVTVLATLSFASVERPFLSLRRRYVVSAPTVNEALPRQRPPFHEQKHNDGSPLPHQSRLTAMSGAAAD
jgi:peptidoglycan/LPS O-acetylase OafA/YrhL